MRLLLNVGKFLCSCAAMFIILWRSDHVWLLARFRMFALLSVSVCYYDLVMFLCLKFVVLI